MRRDGVPPQCIKDYPGTDEIMNVTLTLVCVPFKCICSMYAYLFAGLIFTAMNTFLLPCLWLVSLPFCLRDALQPLVISLTVTSVTMSQSIMFTSGGEGAPGARPTNGI